MATVDVAGDGIALFYASIILLVLSWVTFSMRVGVRIWRKAWGSDDYLMFVGLVLFSVTAALCIVCCYYGAGQLSADLPVATKSKGTKLFYIAEYFYAVSAMFIKCSIAVTLLRIAGTRRRFNWSLWAIIGASVIAALVFCVGIANICHPIGTLWGAANGTCNLKLNSDVSLFYSAIGIVVDWSLAILPAVLLWNVQMKGNVKASVAVILAMASFASCATIVRLNYLTLYSDPGEFMYSTGKIGFWSLMEEGIGVVAGSLPALRPLLSLRLKMSSSATPMGAPASANTYPVSKSRPPQSRSSLLMMDTFHHLGDEDDVEFGDGDSQKNIVKETKYTVTSTYAAGNGEEQQQSQVLGWEQKNHAHV
ncbi:hypothetical protein P153DRAFT_331419 [Dothidotthia symphoricarpi CBS 119687]|uniref:Rhodopsin domain-containing protein n=1 Tax=Dothidotthia symphoricarpi CBS 119687 TaxID=1392245 RepID=A0A6A6AS00_9PLEO|nr:uncharacterized protein P153DRAFT_331419 [Dothidotthia symphoricarpi CBS 119687]KAF2134326.1 hypothetical protein P153DRAFT_331419 [Dothidotthia symphoricarpi CBS 119687]